jgi:hypothetical protein
MNDVDYILAILDDQTPPHIVDAVLCEFMRR